MRNQLRWGVHLIIAVFYSCLLMSQQTEISIDPTPSAEVFLSPFSPSAVPGFDKLVAMFPDLADVTNGLIVDNESTKSVIGLAIRWSMVTADGRQENHTFQSHSYISPGFEPLAGPHERVVVLPGMFIQEKKLATSGLIVARPPQEFLSRFNNARSVRIGLDSIILSDGEIRGPDSLHLERDISARKAAADVVVRQVSASVAVVLNRIVEKAGTTDVVQIQNYIKSINGRLPSSHPIRAALRQLTFDPADAASRHAAQFSRELLHTNHFNAVFEYIQSTPAPPTFYRRDGQPL